MTSTHPTMCDYFGENLSKAILSYNTIFLFCQNPVFNEAVSEAQASNSKKWKVINETISFFKKLGFTPYKAEQPLQSMELKKKAQKD